MHTAYLVVLAACTAATIVLVVMRLVQLRGGTGGEGRARLLNEWAWTLIPLLVLVGLLCHALI